jgi:glutamate synthase (NADPH/NADH) small chain
MVKRTQGTEGKISIKLDEEEFRAVYDVLNRTAGPSGASSRKEISKRHGFSADGHYISAEDMFGFSPEVQKAFEVTASGEVKASPEAAENWAKLAVSALTCSCSLVSCGAADAGYGCPIHRDTAALKRASEGVSLDAQNRALVLDMDVMQDAFNIWFEKFPMGFTGRMCGDHALCMSACTYADINKASEPVLISYFEAYMEQLGQHFGWFDKFYEKSPEAEKNGQSVAIVGAGPAGLMAAQQLLAKGYDVTIYEASDKVGGTVWHGVPHDKYNKQHLEHYRELLEQQGCKFEMGVMVGSDVSVDELEKRHNAYIDATGIADKPRALGIPGEDAKGVIPAMKYLEARNRYVDTMQREMHANGISQEAYMAAHPFDMSLKGKDVIVVGVGYTGFDLVRSALRDQCGGNLYGGFDGSLRWIKRRMDGAENGDYPEAHYDDNKSPTFRMLQLAKEKGGDVEQRFMLAPTEILKDNDGRITGIKYEQREVSNPHIAGHDPSKAEYRVVGEVGDNFPPGREVVLLVAAGYDVKKADTLLDKLGLTDRGKAKPSQNLHLDRVGWYVAGDAVEGRKNEVVHCINSAAQCADAVDRDLTCARAQGEKLSADQWAEQSAIPVEDKERSGSSKNPGHELLQLIHLSVRGR